MIDGTLMREVTERTCEVVGLGISNLPLIGFLRSHGAEVVARDRKTEEELGDTARTLRETGVRLVTGEGYLQNLSAGVIFRSPGLRPDTPEIADAVSRGAILTSEMELFFALTPATLIGITGSDGKTTTTTLTHLFLSEERKKTGRGQVYVGGNIGQPLLPLVGQMTPEDYAVTELSSFQLQTVTRSPERAAVTNLSPNHLNWHTGMEEYAAAKTNIFRHEENRLLVLNAENEWTRGFGKEHAGAVTWFSSAKTSAAEFGLRPGDRAVYAREGTVYLFDGERERAVLKTAEILLPGIHNLENYMTAIALTDGLVGCDVIQKVARTFPGVRHRLEFVRRIDGVAYYNSSIDSSPTRTAAALGALPQKPIVICGGYDKHIPFEPLVETLCAKAKAVVLTGATAERIGTLLNAAPAVRDGTLPVCTVKGFENAVRKAREIAVPGDVVLLSPACASFDAFRNFEERGDAFCAIVRSFGNTDEKC